MNELPFCVYVLCSNTCICALQPRVQVGERGSQLLAQEGVWEVGWMGANFDYPTCGEGKSFGLSFIHQYVAITIILQQPLNIALANGTTLTQPPVFQSSIPVHLHNQQVLVC